MRTTDHEFFGSILNTDLCGLEEIPRMIQEGNIAKAKKTFAGYIRETLKPSIFFSIPFDWQTDTYTYPGESYIHAADRVLGYKLISCGVPLQFEGIVDWHANPTYNQYPEWTWQLSRHYDFYSLARAYRETGDEKYAECFASLAKSWLKQAEAPQNEGPGATLCWRTIEAGIRMSISWPYALHAFYRSRHFTDDLLTDWYKSLWEHGRRLREDYSRANWLIMELSGLASIGVLYPVFKDHWLDFAVNMLRNEISAQIYPDGFQYELATGYHEVVLMHYFKLTKLLKAYSVDTADLICPLENAVSLYVKLCMPDGRQPNINDGTWEPAALSLAPKLDYYPHRKDFQWIATGGVQGKLPEYKSIEFPYAGFMVMRNGWDRDSVWALFDAGPFGRAHQHEDKLNLLIYAYGELLITEGGNYAYDDSEMRKYVLSTRSHNTIRVNGMDQNRRMKYIWNDEDITKRSGIRSFISDEMDWAEGIYDEGYGPDAALIARHRRKVMFIKKPDQGLRPFFIVIDDLTSTSFNEYELLWHFAGKDVSLDGLTFTADKLKGWVAVNDKTNIKARLVKGQTEPEWQGFIATGYIQGEYQPSYTGQFIAKGGNVTLATLFYPLKAAECPVMDFTIEDNRLRIVLESGSHLVYLH